MFAQPDGSGSYELQIDDRTVRVERQTNASWALSDVSPSRRVEYRQDEDGHAIYAERGLRSVDVELAPDQQELGGFTRPEAPEFVVAGRFPPLGSLGSFSPPCAAVIRFDSTLLFELGQATVQDQAQTVLDDVAAAVAQSGKPIEINGHTDSTGSDEFNLNLSLRRAEAVRDELVSRSVNVPIEVVGLGESQPIAANELADGSDNPAGRAQNRRVEIVIRD